MRSIITALIIMSCTTSFASEKASSFSYEFREHKVRILVPNIPQIKLEVHPQHDVKPHLQYMGSNEGYNLSIITPTIDEGMTSLEFADSRVKELTKQFGLSDQQYRVYKQPDSDSFSIFYVAPMGEYTLLTAHLFTVSPLGTHGVDVHISKVAKNKEDIAEWLAGFPEANIK